MPTTMNGAALGTSEGKSVLNTRYVSYPTNAPMTKPGANTPPPPPEPTVREVAKILKSGNKAINNTAGRMGE